MTITTTDPTVASSSAAAASSTSHLNDDMNSHGTGMNKQICDMDEHGNHNGMKKDAMSFAASAIETHVLEKQQAQHIKRAFDAKYGPTWHVIVGSDFKAYVTHESKTFFFFYVGKMAICMYKAG
mmetsp:Transcript_16628/g.20724  ORF Transcript_16628/g.20724 Transcript_16628/m.20724 type:complete len:124 (-) Transcript_16628:211-582(-)|eukprot:CAMPEP_0172505630 /NCGR_PEP_ID=MMETSP1066-20121228/187896_1 /TAXON_ID=671091 /ORGANISM="Coscinodiscus wailesii, Strain CCMP2513" /LENGTH=123 /DNA_ID=CAMNT_0013282321 /DNA_START=213 /DNA_END=584 /DNA_ORIENTATION=-